MSYDWTQLPARPFGAPEEQMASQKALRNSAMGCGSQEARRQNPVPLILAPKIDSLEPVGFVKFRTREVFPKKCPTRVILKKAALH